MRIKVDSNLIAISLITVVLAIVPLLGQSFLIYVGSLFIIFSIFALSYNVLFGYAGLVSFGHGLFFAWGAYATALTTLKLFKDPFIGLVIGVTSSLIPSFVVGFLTLKHTRIYFAILTLAFGMIFYSALMKLRWLTGGSDGLVGIPKKGIVVDISRPEAYFYFMLFFFVVATLSLYVLMKSKRGLLIKALGSNEERLPFLGYSVFRVRMLAFTVSGVGSGLAGSLYAILMGVVTPDLSYWTFSAEPLIMTLLGGAGYFLGPIVGSFILITLTTVAARYYEIWMLTLGVILMLIVVLFRGGLLGFLELAWDRIRFKVRGA